MSVIRDFSDDGILVVIVGLLAFVFIIFGIASIAERSSEPDRPESYCDGNDKVYIYDDDIQVMPASIDCAEGER